MAYHVERVAKIIERELSQILLFEAKNQLLKYVSITKVGLTNDLSLATIWFTVIGNQNEIAATSKALEDSKGFLRSVLGVCRSRGRAAMPAYLCRGTFYGRSYGRGRLYAPPQARRPRVRTHARS